MVLESVKPTCEAIVSHLSQRTFSNYTRIHVKYSFHNTISWIRRIMFEKNRSLAAEFWKNDLDFHSQRQLLTNYFVGKLNPHR